EDLKETLYCIRCSACMNVCANFQAVGGHAFGGECYTGGIGGAWTVATTGSIKDGRFAELCSGCTRCVPNCPVKIDIPRLNTIIKNRLMKIEGGPSVQKLFFGNFSTLAKYASLTPKTSNWISNLNVTRSVMERIIGFDRHRKIPQFANKTLVKQYKEHRQKYSQNKKLNNTLPELILFADSFTNYNSPNIGMAIIKTFDKFGVSITLSKVLAEGRASQSQGLIGLSKRRAIRVAEYLENIIDDGKEIIVAEPSVLALFRYDYKRLINDDILFNKLAKHTFDPIEYINMLVVNKQLKISDYLKKDRERKKLFYHGHCQLKTIGAGYVASEFFKKLGYSVNVSNVECCGMAGSFGYKKEFYKLSKNVGNDLINQIILSDSFNNNTIILANGTSCREQISDELNNPIYHPIEYLETLLKL
ncbi:MAG TPA: (4Fe-4S)-binding protein, partial [Ignavibacteria bacterium]|nr:(4Fe-4S)-binding protein [Ignavibacteria bacterium]